MVALGKDQLSGPCATKKGSPQGNLQILLLSGLHISKAGV